MPVRLQPSEKERKEDQEELSWKARLATARERVIRGAFKPELSRSKFTPWPDKRQQRALRRSKWPDLLIRNQHLRVCFKTQLYFQRYCFINPQRVV
ncbi:Hypothetical predicted protein [Podarcis lilfordi]|uniref:Uncharacterized protein n=1 Tax=Podarcis lilfordi TaxID=74358 RepID=A0AA35KMG7_9SAUR|nr:Hypothetical predicted protein [Podarcis lilfordi]